MRCLRCGYCCVSYMIVVVDDPEKGPVPGNVVGHPGDCRCRHLVGDDPGKLSCAVHGRPWYPKTPCDAHGQIEQSPEDPCRMGAYVLEHPSMVLRLLSVPFRPVLIEEDAG